MMKLLFKGLKLVWLIVLYALSLVAKIVVFFLSVLAEEDNTKSRRTRPIYMLDEQGRDFINDGVTFGYDYNDPYTYKNRPY